MDFDKNEYSHAIKPYCELIGKQLNGLLYVRDNQSMFPKGVNMHAGCSNSIVWLSTSSLNVNKQILCTKWGEVVVATA